MPKGTAAGSGERPCRLGELRRQTAYKAQWARRTHIRVDLRLPSTRRCSAFHAVHAGLTLAGRH